MTDREAVMIVKDINGVTYNPIEKRKAIKLVAGMDAHGNITKAELVEIIRWMTGVRK